MTLRTLLLSALSLLLVQPAALAGPVGPVVQVNQFTVGDQQLPAIARNGAGEVIVAWDSVGQDGSLNGIYARRYGADGLPRGDEFPVNVFTDNRQTSPRVAIDEAGNSVAAWISNSQEAIGIGVYARRFAADGTPLGGEIRVDLPRPSSAHFDLAMNGAGNFVVVWADKQKLGGFNALDVQTIRAQLFEASGQPRGPSFEIYAGNLVLARAPSVAMSAAGGFAVTWFVGPEAIYARRFDAGGQALGNSFRVNALGRLPAVDRPRIAMSADGAFAIAWETFREDFSESGVYARRYDAAGRALSTVFRVGQGLLRNPALAYDGAGCLAVVAHGQGIRLQSYDVHGTALGPETRIDDAADPGTSLFTAIGGGLAPGFVVAWQERGTVNARDVRMRGHAP